MAGDWVDLSQPLFNGMPRAAAHGEPRFWVDEFRTPIPGGENVARVTHLDMAAHVGTHVDAAIHFVPGGKTIGEYGLDAFRGPGVVLDVRRRGVVELTPAELDKARPKIRPGDVVLLWFGYADLYRSPGDYADHPYLTAAGADWLLERDIRLLGVDTVTPDLPGPHRPDGFDFPVHKRLLAKDVLIVENLGPGLGEVAGKRIEFL
ncbi:MAG: cyclase family protein, partial [Actinobacteria bacterium]|nr:cyclase family protein [Actinomycetota bacterium]